MKKQLESSNSDAALNKVPSQRTFVAQWLSIIYIRNNKGSNTDP